MYLHIGNGKTIRKRDVIIMCDLDGATRRPDTKEFLALSERRGKVKYEGSAIPRSFILCKGKGKPGGGNDYVVHLSGISTGGLLGRAVRDDADMYDERS